MPPDPILLLAWLVFAHLIADFVLQTGDMARRKFADGRGAWWALLRHVAVTGVVLLPAVIVFEGPGVLYLLITIVAHGVIDRVKVMLTRRATGNADGGHSTGNLDGRPTEPVDVRIWTPVPGALFAADQVAHLACLLGLSLILVGAPVAPQISEAAGRLLGTADLTAVHQISLWIAVIGSVLIVNVRAASLFISVLVKPPDGSRSTTPAEMVAEAAGRAVGAVDRAVTDRHATADPAATGDQGPSVALDPSRAAEAAAAYIVRVGPIVGRIEARSTRPPGAPASSKTAVSGPAERSPAIADAEAARPPARVGETIGIIERVLIVGLILAGGVEAVGLVIAAKTLARFKQLEDRAFAEYYVLGTLASVTIAVGSALIARAVLFGA